MVRLWNASGYTVKESYKTLSDIRFSLKHEINTKTRIALTDQDTVFMINNSAVINQVFLHLDFLSEVFTNSHLLVVFF